MIKLFGRAISEKQPSQFSRCRLMKSPEQLSFIVSKIKDQ